MTCNKCTELQAENLQMREAFECLKDIISISDRKHNAWDKAKIIIAKIEGGHTQKLADRIKALEELETAVRLGDWKMHADTLSKLDALEKE